MHAFVQTSLPSGPLVNEFALIQIASHGIGKTRRNRKDSLQDHQSP